MTDQRNRDEEARARIERDSRAQADAAQQLSEIVAACSRGDVSRRIDTRNKTGIFGALCVGISEISSDADRGLDQLGDRGSLRHGLFDRGKQGPWSR